MRIKPLLFALFAGLATTAAQAAAYTVTVTGTLSGAWDNAGIFGPARTSLNGKAFTATLEVDEETPGSFHALDTPSQRMLVGTYSASPVLGWLTVNGITRQVQPLQGTVFVINDHGAVPQDAFSFKASSDNFDGGVYYDDWVDFGVNDSSRTLLDSTVVPATYDYTVPGALTLSGSFRFQNSRDGYLASGGFGVTGFTIASAAPVPEPENWALLIGGLGVLGASLRARRAATRNAFM